MPLLSHSSWFEHPSVVSWGAQSIRLLVLQSSPFSCDFISLRPKRKASSLTDVQTRVPFGNKTCSIDGSMNCVLFTSTRFPKMRSLLYKFTLKIQLHLCCTRFLHPQSDTHGCVFRHSASPACCLLRSHLGSTHHAYIWIPLDLFVCCKYLTQCGCNERR